MKLRAALLFASALAVSAADPQITGFTPSGLVTVINSFPAGVVTLESSSAVTGPWLPALNRFSTSAQTLLQISTTDQTQFIRALTADLTGPQGFSNLVQSFSTLTTIAGNGGATTGNKWSTAFENGPATNAFLSRPHITMQDQDGNYFIADKDSHGIRKVTPAGIISTVAGTSVAGNGADTVMAGTQCALNEPNGLYVATNGIVYILDLQNGKIRRLARDGMINTFITIPGGLSIGRGLWVSEDETLAYISSGTALKKWTPSGGVVNFATGFSQLGNLVIDPSGSLVVTDRGAHVVYRYAQDGSRTVIAGNGTTSGGGDGQLATATGLAGVRTVCFLPTGAFFLGTEAGADVWYVDTAGIIHFILNGSSANPHAGDGTWFYQPDQPRVGTVRAITTDRMGNLLITENDAGYIRKIEFLRHGP